MTLYDDDSNDDDDEKEEDEEDAKKEFIGFSWDQETNMIKKLEGRSDEVNLI